MKGTQVKRKLIANGYGTDEVAQLLGLSHEEFMKILDSENIPDNMLNSISEAVGENIFDENTAPTNIIEGDNNVLGNNNNANETILKLINMLEKKDNQINRLLNIIDKLKLTKTHKH